jgi:hypothetical protein
MKTEREHLLPLLIMNRVAGTITIIYQIVGATTEKLNSMNEGERIT